MWLKTLGELSLEGVPFKRAKPLLLLSYLAVEGPKERWLLKELFWRDATNPQNSLATAVAYLRKASPGLVGTDDASVWCEVECDARQLLEALESRENDKAVELYSGAFLAGVDPSAGGAELEEWIYATRELLGSRIRQALLTLGAEHAGVGEFSSGAELALRAYLLPGAPEPEPVELERLFVLLQAGEHPGASEVRKEARAFDVELSMPVEEAKSALQKDAGTTTKGAQNTLPVQATRFVGRERELAEISEMLTNPDCRLVSLVGVGGLGKTRLALAAAQEQLEGEDFADGVVFVALEAVTGAASFPAVVAGALGLTLSGQEDAQSVVLRFLEGKRMLLVLDNFEQVLEGASFVREITLSCPGVKVLVTSRERLNLQNEWVFAVEGLTFPEESTTLAGAESFDAVKLFVQRARQAHQDFSLTTDVLPAVMRICRLVEGMPLAIELVSSWLKALPAIDISRELESSIDLLESPARDVPERHRSVRAVFDYSWALLNEQEREVLSRLSVFRGGFTREAANVVAGATLPVLARLVDKSLLRMSPEGRFTQHPLLWQYLRDKATDEPETFAQTQEKHAAYFTDLMHAQQALHQGMDAKTVRTSLERDLANVREAWFWATDHGRESFLDRALETLTEFHFQSGRYREGEALLAYAAEKLQSQSVVHGRILRNMGQAHGWKNHYETGAAALEKSIGIFQKYEAKHDEALALQKLTFNYEMSPRSSHDIEALWRRCAQLFREVGDRYNEARILANVALYSRDPQDREQQLRESIRLHREVEGYFGITLSLTNLAICLTQSYGVYQEAYEALSEAIGFERARGVEFRLALWLNWQGNVLVYRGEYDTAETRYLEARSISETLELRIGEAELDHALLGLGRLELLRGDLEEATGYLREALASNLCHPDTFGLRTEIYHALADVAIREGRFSDAEELSHEALRYFHEHRHETYERAWTESFCHHQLGVIALATNDVPAAQDHFCKALAVAREWHLLPATLQLVVAFAKMAQRHGNAQRAASLLAVVANHPASMSETTREARRELEAFPEELVEADLVRAQVSTPESIAEELLADLCTRPKSGDLKNK